MQRMTRSSLLGRLTRRALLCSLLVASGCALACSSSRGPVARAGASGEASGLADDGTWLGLEAQGARLRAPTGWTWTRRGDRFVAEPTDRKAALVLAGATSVLELATLLRTIGAEHGVDRLELGTGRRATLHGIPVVVYEDQAAESSSKPVDVLTLVGDAPSGRGVVVVVVLASDLTQAHDVALIDAANSLRPL
jgi:hypothetical protein